MKILRRAYLMALAAMTAVMAACSSDGDNPDGSGQPVEGMARVTLHVSPAPSAAVTRWADDNATDDEMMNIWVVVIATEDDAVEKVLACKPTGEGRETDAIATLPTGTHHFYSFANMSVATVATTLGITVTMPAMTDNDEVYEATAASGTVDADKAVTVGGNGFAALTSSADNGFGSYGIPMSNRQEATIVGSTTLDLIVVRMLAKMELQLYNETGSEVTVKSVTLSDVTGNVTSNLMLLPTLSHPDDMEAYHQDIRPHLNTSPAPAKTAYTYPVPAAKQTVATAAYSGGTPAQTLTFYVNESATPTNAEGLFYLTLEVDNAGASEFRYALVSNNADNEWNYIARNDYRIIPIVLDDLKFEIVPYDFPPIGVYPCSVKEVDATNHVYDFEFHDYGHFHLLPTVTKGGTVVDFSAATPAGSGYKWTLVDNDWTKSWFTYAAFGDASQTANPGGFYRTGTGSTTADGDDEGQTPVWYVNDGVAGPRWAPDAANYRPFIFGYIADPGAALASDKRVCHEMKIQVYNGTSAYRQMLYRFYMTLSMDQMLYSRGQTSMPRKRH